MRVVIAVRVEIGTIARVRDTEVRMSVNGDTNLTNECL